MIFFIVSVLFHSVSVVALVQLPFQLSILYWLPVIPLFLIKGHLISNMVIFVFFRPTILASILFSLYF